MTQFHELEEGETFQFADDRRPDTTCIKENMADDLIGANARKVESGDTCFIPLSTEVEHE